MRVRVRKSEVFNPDSLKLEVDRDRLDIVITTGHYDVVFMAGNDVDFAIFPSDGRVLALVIYSPSPGGEKMAELGGITVVSGVSPGSLAAFCGDGDSVTCSVRMGPGTVVVVREEGSA